MASGARRKESDRNSTRMEGLWAERHTSAAPKPEKQYLAQEKSVVFRVTSSGTKKDGTKNIRDINNSGTFYR
jgi:hypothetical protein